MNSTPFAHCGNPAVCPDLRLVDALIPGQLHRRHIATLAIFVSRLHRGRGHLRLRRRAGSLDRQRCIELQCPKRQIDPMAAQIRHRAVAEIPPAIPLRSREVDIVERPLGRRAEPQIPVQPRWDRIGCLSDAGLHGDDVAVLLGFCCRLPTPSPRYPNVRLAHRTDGARSAPIRRRGDSFRRRESAFPFAWRLSPWQPLRESSWLPKCCASAVSRNRHACLAAKPASWRRHACVRRY